MNQNLHVNKTNFHMKSFALGLALKQRRKATRKSPIVRVAPQITAKSPPNAPETQELATTQVSGAGWTILLHFSIFWVQFRIFHTLFSLSLHFVSVRLPWRSIRNYKISLHFSGDFLVHNNNNIYFTLEGKQALTLARGRLEIRSTHPGGVQM